MIWVITDDARLQVLPDIDSVRRECEPIDVEDGIYLFFDSDGFQLVPYFIESVTKESHLFGLVTSVHGGQFDLVPSGERDPHKFEAAVATVEEVEPNSWFTDLEEVYKFVQSNRSRHSDTKTKPMAR